MKVGWQTVALGELCDILDNKRKPITKRDRKPGEYPYYGATGIQDFVEGFLFDEPLVLVGEDGAKWASGENTAFAIAGKCWVNNHAHVLRPNRALLTDNWLIHFLVQSDLSPFVSGLTVPKLNQGNLREIPIPLPPLPEQHRIVAILDEAFDGIATAKANAEKNLQNARALFESHLKEVFSQDGGAILESEGRQIAESSMPPSGRTVEMGIIPFNTGHVTRTGGRDATLRHIPGPLSLCVGMPNKRVRKDWRWSPLSNLARLESGHTPSRRHPEYWGGSIPWIGIQDARIHHGRYIEDTIQKTNENGIENSSARVLPENTVCLSRTASVGYVVVMKQPMATSQDFVNWVCSPKLNPNFLKYLFLAEGREGLLRYGSGSVHQTIYFPEAKAFHICHPEIDEQSRIVDQCDALVAETQRLESIYQRKLTALDDLKKSLLHQAFSGNL